VSVTPIHNARGELKYFLCIQKPAMPAASPQSSDVEVSLLQRELGRARQKIANLDRVDQATGLMRFDYFEEVVRRDLAIGRRERRVVTVLVFEIVEFDVYRQTFGSKAADSCQRMIGAQILRTLRRAGDLCARYDECTLVAAVIGQDTDEIQHLADKIAENVRKLGLHNPRAQLGRYVTVRTALVACTPGKNDDARSAIERALASLHSKADSRAALS
jgi:diguanylate cyclase (GGDEF)-like protein